MLVHGAAAAAARAAAPPPPPPPPPAPPQPKKPRVDPATGLMSAADFAETLGTSRSITVRVKCPLDDSNAAWSLLGQEVAVEVDCMATVKEVKALLKAQLGMPENKQQLKHARLGVLKDALSLAHFNIASGALLDLVVRARGRR
jgi:splicing factor 3A subunit 1